MSYKNDAVMDYATIERLDRYEHYYGDIVPADRREAIAADPNSIGAADVDAYLSMAIEKPKPRPKEEVDGKRLGKRATKKLIRQLQDELSGSIM